MRRPPMLLIRMSIGPRARRGAAGALALLGDGGVGLDRPRLAAERPDVGGGAGEAVGVAADQDDVGAGFGDGERHLAAETAAAAGDEQALVVEAEAVEDGHGSTSQCWIHKAATGGLRTRL